MKKDKSIVSLSEYSKDYKPLDEGLLDYAKSLGSQVGSKVSNSVNNKGRDIINKGKQLGQQAVNKSKQLGQQAVDKASNLHNQAKAESRKQDLIKQVKKEYEAYREQISEANKMKADFIRTRKALASEYNITLDDLGIQTGRKK